MPYNIFDVVLHPSVFQHYSSNTPHSEPPSLAPSAPVSMSKSCTRTVVDDRHSAAPWGEDEWSEIRRRLWNAKRPMVGSPFALWMKDVRIVVDVGFALQKVKREAADDAMSMPPRQLQQLPLSRPKRKNPGGRPESSQKRQAKSNNDILPTLLDIFRFLDSPDPQPFIKICKKSEFGDIFQACTSPGNYTGMRTCLYQYQKNSLFKMLRRELLPDLFLDPKFTPMKTIACGSNGNISTEINKSERYRHPLLPYVQFSHGFGGSDNPWLYEHRDAPGVPVMASDVAWYGGVRGGIICEDMGTGKTCECLALIIITKRQMAQPPIVGEVVPCVGTVTSALTTDYKDVEATSSKVLYTDRVNHRQIPRLKAMATRAALLSCVESLRVMHDDGMISDEVWRSLEPYPPYYWVDPIADSRSRRGVTNGAMDQMLFKVYMSSSTIVVVPDNLVDQWVREKYKHIEDDGGLEVLKIDNSTEIIPEPDNLIAYDLVLVSVSRLSKEYIPIDSKIRELRNTCRCYSRGQKQCICDLRQRNAVYRSPLLRVHWKRLIVDEGHIMTSRNTTRALMAAYLIAERRWICTGTPTHNLVHATSALTPGAHFQTESEATQSSQVSGSDLEISTHDPDVSDEPTASTATEISITSATTAHRKQQMNPRESSSDFLQLGILLSKFLRMDPFARSTSAWTSIMVQPYKRGDVSARMRLKALMQSIMVRNCAESVSNEVQLPPLYERVISLPATRLQALTYNAVVAFFHINAVLTERSGRDYFFHPENKKHLRQIVSNLFLACFWFPISPKHIQDGIVNGQRALELWENNKKPYSAEDVALLRRSISELQRAAGDAGWLHIVKEDSTGYLIEGISQKLGAKLHFAQDYMEHLDDGSTAPLSNAAENIPPSYLLTAAQLQHAILHVKEMLITGDDILPPLASNISPDEFEELRLARICACSSNKISFIVDNVQQYCKNEKCIVFVSSQGEAALIDDALQLAQIPHLLYASSAMNQNQRRHNITTFSTSVWYNVLVIDVHLAAYGIDLSAASRVWFTSPIWLAARERQAIKRAHRLGQQRPVIVETLVTEGSIEEALWRRRQEISNDDNYARDIEDDGKMRSTLSNAKFIDNRNSGNLKTCISVLPPNIRYPKLLRQKYEMWSSNYLTSNATKQLPFPKTRRLVLTLPPSPANNCHE
ncbi:hypothetical protein COEREDRAFT_10810 [Coemansia reversa NRRL 1564]|uniref:Helicase C-terminal domain-containing protein n=1 Tax=Coemansia reversa (strain ATCC 12441 / NRRL 1564) TaxID=763665 RepID=A0A2G5B4T8_COERN|nr:hypothetical protein COEREDRAFT_10810 [Coemansia reversa NRRL 1564]|eukprot:PIA14019.1 hypothetical protein COEREDRAFT_10810 [Coemansia reversa NRRL 1564]